MASNQLDKMSVKELVDLESRLKKTIAAARDREKSAVKQKLEAIIESAGLDAGDVIELLGLTRSRGARKGAKVAPKYRNPENRLETWTGRGRQPRWLVAKLSKGGKLQDYAI